MTDVLPEVWVTTTESHNYEVSSLGRIRRCTPGRYSGMVGRIRKLSISPNGYLTVSLDEGKWFSVHRIVCRAFNGLEPSPKHQVAHNNGIRVDNRPENLRWATASENNFDQDQHGTRVRPRGERQGRAILTSDRVRDIHRRNIAGESMKVLSQEYGVAYATIRSIMRGYNWKHLGLINA